MYRNSIQRMSELSRTCCEQSSLNVYESKGGRFQIYCRYCESQTDYYKSIKVACKQWALVYPRIQPAFKKEISCLIAELPHTCCANANLRLSRNFIRQFKIVCNHCESETKYCDTIQLACADWQMLYLIYELPVKSRSVRFRPNRG